MRHEGVRRRWTLAHAIAAVSALGIVACSASAAAAPPTPTVEIKPTPSPYQVQVQMKPQDAQLGKDDNVVIQARFTNVTGGQSKPVAGAQLTAIVNYPSGPKTYASDVTTFSDGVTTLAVPVAPATRGSNVRVEVVMKYQGQEYHSISGFTVR
jgi:hypothetical protein